MTEAMAHKINELFELRDKLLLSNMEWTRLSREVDADGINYQTIRRIERGGTPYGRTLRILESALILEEQRQNAKRSAERQRNHRDIARAMAAAQPEPKYTRRERTA